ncbi:MAG: PRC-barrel domain-containing protein [Selenomonadaceae bacterium]|nr:PRC-barrel domain-containing protein [Selenomonadaceae bacterium]
MKKSAEILGLPIISITEGRELGTSKTLVIDAKNGLIAAITVEDEEWYRGVKLIPYDSIIAIGDDAITILHSDKILKLNQVGDFESMLDENIKILGTKAITRTGKIRGKICEIFVGDDGKIEKCEILANDGSISEVAAADISIFGKQVTMIDPESVKKNSQITEKVQPVEKEMPAPVVEEKPAEEKPVEEIVELVAQDNSDEDISENDDEEIEEPDYNDFEPEPKVETLSDAKQMSGTNQAEALKAALKRAMENQQKAAPSAPQNPAPKKGGKTVTIVGRKVSKNITTDNGTLIIEAGGEITEEILQKARAANKFTDLLMNSIA